MSVGQEMWGEILNYNLPSLEETVRLPFPGSRTVLEAELIPSSGMSFGDSSIPCVASSHPLKL